VNRWNQKGRHKKQFGMHTQLEFFVRFVRKKYMPGIGQDIL
jgi:hypothetical protein